MGATQPFCRQCNDYSGLVEAVRDRSEQMELSRLELDRISGLADGAVAKIIGARPAKRFGMTSLGAVLQTLGLILVVVEDPAARDKTLARRTPFKASNRRVGNTSRLGNDQPQIESPTASVIEPPKPRSDAQVTRSHLRVIQPRLKGTSHWGGAL